MGVTKGPMKHYMIKVRTYGGATDQDLCKKTKNIGTVQKYINLLALFLRNFMGRGCSCTMDSAYMGQLLAMLAREVWKINVVGTTQTNRCGPDGALVKKAKTVLKVRSYESIFFYHKFKPLCVALWGDNNIVTTLSNHHPPRLLRAGTGVHRRLLGDDGFQEKEPSPVKIPMQTKKYINEYDKIDKINLCEVKFDLKGNSKKHGWSPKLNNRYLNIHGGNAGVFYERLHRLYTPRKRLLKPREQMADLAHYLCRLGPNLKTHIPRHPLWLRDLTRVYHSTFGRQVRSDCRGVHTAIVPYTRTANGPGPSVMASVARLNKRKVREEWQKRSPWRHHQSRACPRRDYCNYEHCPGLQASKAKRPRKYKTHMRCEECSEMLGYDWFLCNDVKGRVEGQSEEWNVVNCHHAFHSLFFNNK